jgi:hypothetical protein
MTCKFRNKNQQQRQFKWSLWKLFLFWFTVTNNTKIQNHKIKKKTIIMIEKMQIDHYNHENY